MSIPWKKRANEHFDNLLKCVFYISLFSFFAKNILKYICILKKYNKLNFKKLYIKS